MACRLFTGYGFWKIHSRTLEKMVKFQVYLEGEKRKAGCIASDTRQYNPPVCQEVSLQSISSILPQNRLISSFCLTLDQVRNGVRHCLLPQSYLILLLCCNLLVSALPHHLVFSSCVLLPCLFMRVGGTSNDRDRARNASESSC